MIVLVKDGITGSIVNQYSKVTSIVCEEQQGATTAMIYWKDEEGIERRKAQEDLRRYNIEVL